ncbi:MAG: DEAD/DEAH box helicase [Candidatus Marinarcus sp.]|uniref:DEAD/DEAH box helicase n=1 Tax=Candidatus Marinarcus sp. TaxID=3100987 RepID=UPI003B0087E5
MPEILKAIKEEGYETPTEIQKKAIPIILKKRDVLAAAQSGTGKTAAFVLPILEDLAQQKRIENKRVLRCLILVPTRELASQVARNISFYARYLDIVQTTAVGGLSNKLQAAKIAKGIDILVATPGRLIDHIQNKAIDLASINTLVLDEADTMLDMGFLEEIEKIFPLASSNRQIMMFSATLNQNVKKLAKEFLKDPVVIEITPQRSTVKIIDQQIIKVDFERKAELLSYLIGSRNWTQVLVFANTKATVDLIVDTLNLDGLPALAIHGDIKQPARARALRKFKDQEIRVLVATDIAARGIDIEGLPHVINFDLPDGHSDYTHRIGRTGRAGNPGVATTLLCVKEYKEMIAIEKELIINIPRMMIEGFELTEKEPRVKKVVHKKLSEKKGLREKKPKEKMQRRENKEKKSKKTTKRDANRKFGKR